MKERPILMADPLVLAIERGEKTVTRRPINDRWCPTIDRQYLGLSTGRADLVCPYGAPGDRLWIRERARVIEALTVDGERELALLRYEASGDEAWVWWPERIMPTPVGNCIANGVFLEAARTIVEITRVGVERVRDITEEQAIAEGFRPREPRGHIASTARWQFQTTWEQAYPESWSRNDWVWAIEFRVVVCKGIKVAA